MTFWKTAAILLAAACALPARAPAQMYDTTNRLDHVRKDTLMWSLADPFAFQATSNLISRTDALSNGVAAANLQIEAGVDALAAETDRARAAEAALAAYTNRADTALQAGATNAVYAHYGPRVSALEALTNAVSTALQPAATNSVYAFYDPLILALAGYTNTAATALQAGATNAVYSYYNPRISALAAYTNRAATALQPASTNGWNTLPFLDWVLRSEVVGLVASAVEAQLAVDLDQLPGFSNTVYAAVLPRLGEWWHTNAPATPASYFAYETNSAGEIIITDYAPLRLEKRVAIPPRIDGRPVVGVGYAAFNGDGSLVESLELPETLRDIGAQAFPNMTSLNSRLVIPASVTNVGTGGFAYLPAAMGDRMVLFEGDMPDFGTGGFQSPFLGDTEVTVLRRSGTSGWGSFNTNDISLLATIGPAEAVVLNGTTNLVSGGIVDLGSVTASAAEKLDRVGGTSTNQVLQSATVTNRLAFGTAFADALAAGEIAWDPDWATFRAGLPDGVTGQFFQESHIYAKNVSGQTVTNGMAVRFSGAVGNSGKCEFVLAKAEPGIRPATTLGIATHDIPNGELGKITWFGNVNAIDTTGALYGETGWTDNMIVFLSTNKLGYLTRYEPQAPYPRISLGAVINRHAQNGSILVRPTWGMKVTDADDVDGTPLTTTGQIMVWDAARGIFDFTDNINRYAVTNGSVKTLADSAQPSRYFMEVVNSTGTVFEVTGPFTNLMVTLSDDFEETVTHTRPAWTNNVFPFTEGQWVGGVSENTEGNADYYYIESSAGTTVAWSDTTETLPASLTLVFGDGAGTATVSVGNIYYTTNAIKHFSTEAELEAAKAACGVVLTNTVNGAVSSLTADIASATNALMPYARTLYGDVSTTNETGYAAFASTNAAESYSALVPSSAVGSFTNIFRYNFNGVRKFGTLTNTAWFLKSGFGAGYKAVSTVVSVKDAAGNVLASSASQPVNIDQPVTTQAAITNTLAIPLNIYSGTVEIACIAVSTNASFSVRLYSGAQYTNILTFSEAPTPYATHTELRSLRAEIPAIVDGIARSIRTSETNIVVSSTNSVYYVALTNAANVGFDFSALSLGGTKRADITAVIDCMNTQALYSVINTNLVAMDCPWEPTVTGRYELAVSSDGVRTKVVQNSPSMCVFAPALINLEGGNTSYGALNTTLMTSGTLSREISIANENNPRELAFLRLAMIFNWPEVDGHLSFVCGSAIMGAIAEFSSVTNSVYAYPSGVFGHRPAYIPMRPAAAVSGFALPTRLVRVIKDVDDSRETKITSATIRRMNALERAAYNAGAYPEAFRLDY